MNTSQFKPEQIKRIVVRGTSWVGDAVMTIPALRELRQLFPEAHITLATRSWAKGIFDGADFLDELLVSDQRGVLAVGEQAKQWAGRFDLAVIFPNSFASALIPALARIPLRVGYATESRRLLLNLPLAVPEWRSTRHEIFYYLNIVRELGETVFADLQPDRAPDPLLRISSEREMRGKQLLSSTGVAEGAAVVALCPGSINSRAKRWPAERFASLGDRLIVETGANVLLIGSDAELDISHEVAALMKHQPKMLTGRTDLAELVDVLSQTDLLITNDTGPAHIAAALGRKTIVIFGPTNPLTTRPFSDSAELMREPPDCAPCMLRDCPIDHRCMTAITPDQVFERALAQLSSVRSHLSGLRVHDRTHSSLKA